MQMTIEGTTKKTTNVLYPRVRDENYRVNATLLYYSDADSEVNLRICVPLLTSVLYDYPPAELVVLLCKELQAGNLVHFNLSDGQLFNLSITESNSKNKEEVCIRYIVRAISENQFEFEIKY